MKCTALSVDRLVSEFNLTHEPRFIDSCHCILNLQRRREGADGIRKANRDALLKAKRRRTEAGTEVVHLDEDAIRTAVSRFTVRPGAERLEAIKLIRRTLSRDEGAPIDTCLSVGLIPALQALLGFGQTTLAPEYAHIGPVSEEERVECLWIVTNVAAGSHDDTLAVLAVSPYVVGLLRADSGLVAEHAAWAVGNIAGDSFEARDALAKQGAIQPLCELIKSRHHATGRTACWAATNMLRGPHPAAPFVAAGAAAGALRWMSTLLATAEAEIRGAPRPADGAKRDDELLAEAAWVLSFISSKEEQLSHELAAAGALQLAVRALALAPLMASVTPCLRIVGNIGSLSDKYIEAALDVRVPKPTASGGPGGSALLGALARILTPIQRGDDWMASQARKQGAAGAGDSNASSGIGNDEADDEDDGDMVTPSPAGGSAALSAAVAPHFTHYTHGHVQEALWVAGNIAGSTPPAAATLLCTPVFTGAMVEGVLGVGNVQARVRMSRAGSVLEAPSPAALGLSGLGLLPLLVHHLGGVWQVRRQAAHALLNLAAQRAAITSLPPSAPPAVVQAVRAPASQHPFLSAILCFPDVPPRYVALLEAPDVEMVHVGLSFLDVLLHAWRPPAAGEPGRLVAQRVASLPPPPQLDLAAVCATGVCGAQPAFDWLAVSPPFEERRALHAYNSAASREPPGSGAAIVREAGAPDALDALHVRYQMAEDPAAAALSRRAGDLFDTFFNEEGDEELDFDEDDGDADVVEEDEDLHASAGAGSGGNFSFGVPAAAPGASGGFSFNAASFSFGPGSGVVPGASAGSGEANGTPAGPGSPMGRGRGAITPAWMSAAGAGGR